MPPLDPWLGNELSTWRRMQALEAQLRQREDQMLKLEAVHGLLKGQLEARAAEAEARAARATRAAAQQEQRRALDMEASRPWELWVGQRKSAPRRTARQRFCPHSSFLALQAPSSPFGQHPARPSWPLPLCRVGRATWPCYASRW